MYNKLMSFLRTGFCSLFVLWTLFFLCPSPAFAAGDAVSARVQFKDVVARARALADAPLKDPRNELPDILKNISYDQWRDIRFNPARSLWAGQPFSVQFFHPGFLYDYPVLIHYTERDGTREFLFSSKLFEYADKDLQGHLPDGHGFAGFRVHYPLNTPKYADELVAFLGASYFRALGRDLFYGLSARGLAIDTAEAGGEEFPFFREFWIRRPAPGEKEITVYALLDSRSLTGAYSFRIVPGEETIMQVDCTLFMRQDVRKLGIAPLTSMFFYGENSGSLGDRDFRPEVHDSDGLQVHARSGEWIWHPLADPRRLLVNAFGGGQPKGFGLMQRDTNFDHYQDLEARYEKRPSLWVEPEGDWGEGHIELVQIPTESEYNDNIVAYWVPERKFARGDTVSYSYTLFWHSARRPRSAEGFAAATRFVKKDDGGMFVIDFAGDKLKALPLDLALTSDVWVSRGAVITGTQLMKNTVTGGWRLVLHVTWNDAGFIDDILPGQKPAVEFRAFLKNGKLPVTETWSYTYLP